MQSEWSVPTVVDRLIQQAMHQVMSPRPLDTAQTALPDLAALGTGYPCAATDRAGVHEAESVVLRLQRTRPVVECRVLTHDAAYPNSAFERMGLISIVATVRAFA